MTMFKTINRFDEIRGGDLLVIGLSARKIKEFAEPFREPFLASFLPKFLRSGPQQPGWRTLEARYVTMRYENCVHAMSMGDDGWESSLGFARRGTEKLKAMLLLRRTDAGVEIYATHDVERGINFGGNMSPLLRRITETAKMMEGIPKLIILHPEELDPLNLRSLNELVR